MMVGNMSYVFLQSMPIVNVSQMKIVFLIGKYTCLSTTAVALGGTIAKRKTGKFLFSSDCERFYWLGQDFRSRFPSLENAMCYNLSFDKSIMRK